MLSLGFSPCPNDTYIFYGLATGRVDAGDIRFRLCIEDVETLNRMAVNRSLDITKVSCHAYLHIRDDYRFLDAGAALGRGCGPLIVVKKPYTLKDLPTLRIAAPGGLTTAALLFRLYCKSVFGFKIQQVEAMPFHQIMDAVRDGKVDAGLIIHEGRFTYPSYGLVSLMDLGQWWEDETGLPIPLGGIAGKKSLGEATLMRVENLIRSSVNYSQSNTEEALPYIRRYARELSESVIKQHIGLYVNDFTISMGEEGRAALDLLLNKAKGLL